MRIIFSNTNQLIGLNFFCASNDLTDAGQLSIGVSSRWLNIHPACLAFTAAIAKKVGKENTYIDTTLPKAQIYLDRMGLYEYSNSICPVEYNKHEESGRFIPITNIRTEAEQSKFISNLHPLLHLPPEKSDVIKYVLGELIRNTLEHSRTSDGTFVAVQYNATKNKIRVGICDTGIGLRASLEKYHHPKDDLDAIRLALMPGISGTTAHSGGTGDNAGAGLYVVKSLVKASRDYLYVYSGDSAYKMHKYDRRIMKPRFHDDPFDEKCALYDGLPNFGGTLIGLDISLSDTDAFNDTLEGIKVSYSKAIQSRKKQQYKEIIFR